MRRNYLCLVFALACRAPTQSQPQPTQPAQVTQRANAQTVATAGGDGAQRFAELGTCTLASGERIDDCRIGFRTFGKLDAAKSNAILFPTWFTGTSAALTGLVPGKLVDTDRFFLILVDAIGNGVSSSPSNSSKQPRLAFPRFGIRDMIESQRRLLKEVFDITKLHAVMGISMGGMQTFEWAVAYGHETSRAVSIVGTPQLTSHDLLLWNAELHALDDSTAYAGGNYEGRPRIRVVQDIHTLMLTTPAFRASETTRDQFPAWLEKMESDNQFDWNDWHRQLEAMLAHDVARGSSLATVAKRTKTKMLVVVSEQDHMVYPGPAKTFAAAQGSKLVVLPGACGHVCDATLFAAEVRAFLEQ